MFNLHSGEHWLTCLCNMSLATSSLANYNCIQMPLFLNWHRTVHGIQIFKTLQEVVQKDFTYETILEEG